MSGTWGVAARLDASAVAVGDARALKDADVGGDEGNRHGEKLERGMWKETGEGERAVLGGGRAWINSSSRQLWRVVWASQAAQR